jgi:HK97 family phage prohead protease
MERPASDGAFRLETKYQPLKPSPDSEPGRLQGYASVFGLTDDGGDVVEPGAFEASLRRRGTAVKLLWQHDPGQPIGVWESLREDPRGLFVEGRLLTEVRRGAEAAALLAAGAIDGLSIGYRVVRAEKSPRGGRRLLEIDLWEVSLVTFPMLSAARTERAAEPPGDGRAVRSLADALRNARESLT